MAPKPPTAEILRKFLLEFVFMSIDNKLLKILSGGIIFRSQDKTIKTKYTGRSDSILCVDENVVKKNIQTESIHTNNTNMHIMINLTS